MKEYKNPTIKPYSGAWTACDTVGCAGEAAYILRHDGEGRRRYVTVLCSKCLPPEAAVFYALTD